MDVETSVGRALATSGSAVLFAAITVCIALCGLALIPHPLRHHARLQRRHVRGRHRHGGHDLLPAMLGLIGHQLNSCGHPTKPARARPVQHLGPVGPRGGPRQGSLSAVVSLAPARPTGAEDRSRLHVRRQRSDGHHAAPGLRPARQQGFGPGVNGPLLVGWRCPRPPRPARPEQPYGAHVGEQGVDLAGPRPA